MNKRQASIITAYTGISFGGGDLAHDFHKYVEEKFEKPVCTHEMRDEGFWDYLKKLAHDDFLELAKSINELSIEDQSMFDDNQIIEPIVNQEDIKIEDYTFNKDEPNVYYCFDNRTIHCLINEGITTVNQLLSHCEHQLLKIPNLGRLTLKDIKTKLAYKNLKLCMLPFYYYDNSYCSKCHSCKNFIAL